MCSLLNERTTGISESSVGVEAAGGAGGAGGGGSMLPSHKSSYQQIIAGVMDDSRIELSVTRRRGR